MYWRTLLPEKRLVAMVPPWCRATGWSPVAPPGPERDTGNTTVNSAEIVATVSATAATRPIATTFSVCGAARGRAAARSPIRSGASS